MSTLSSPSIHSDTLLSAAPALPLSAGPAAELPFLAGVLRFHRRHARKLRPLLSRLAHQGQSPAQLFITCADSRIVPNVITGTGPGELFTVRNIGNLVPQHRPGGDAGDTSVAAAIEFATESLGVRAITVCGHSGCGAVAAMLKAEHTGPGHRHDGPGRLPGLGATAAADDQGQEQDQHSPLAEWLRHGEPSLERLRSGEPGGPERFGSTAHEQLCRLNVIQQLDHLATYPRVRQRVVAGRLCLIGMYFDLAHTRVEVYDPWQQRFVPVPG